MNNVPIYNQLEHIDFDYVDLARRFEELSQIKVPQIAVVGDFCLDKYLYIYPQLDETSVETQKTAYQIRAKRIFAGVGGTIAANLCALGASVYCFGAIGNDGEGFDLLRSLKTINANVDNIIISDDIITGTYMKPMRPSAPSINGTLQAPNEGRWEEDNRLDIRNPGPVPSPIMEDLKKRLLESLSQFDAIVVSDQFSQGSEAVFSQDFRKFLSQTAKRNSNVFFLCDSRFFINDYHSVLVKCNANELLDAYRSETDGVKRRETTLDNNSEKKQDELIAAGAWLVKRNNRPALVTRGASGSILIELNNTGNLTVSLIPAIQVSPPIDICGAGDATNAGFAYARSLGFNLAESAYLAGVVSSITIKQLGVTGVASTSQILDVLKSPNSPKNK